MTQSHSFRTSLLLFIGTLVFSVPVFSQNQPLLGLQQTPFLQIFFTPRHYAFEAVSTSSVHLIVRKTQSGHSARGILRVVSSPERTRRLRQDEPVESWHLVGRSAGKRGRIPVFEYVPVTFQFDQQNRWLILQTQTSRGLAVRIKLDANQQQSFSDNRIVFSAEVEIESDYKELYHATVVNLSPSVLGESTTALCQDILRSPDL